LTLQHRLRWVKAHQDDKKPYEDLDIWVKWIATPMDWQKSLGN
jgi:hypothetical protein